MARKDKLINRIGEENYNTFGTKMKIVEYKNAHDIIVEFQDEHKVRVHTEYKNFKINQVKNPYDKTFYGVGYLGEGAYSSITHRRILKTWQGMLERCYEPYYINKHFTYKDCYVCDEWLCFQNFARWYEDNYYECNNERIELDKDILHKGNKTYSPETCVFVPQRINKLLTKSDKLRGKLPIGCAKCERDRKILVQCNTNKGKQEKLGTFPLDRPFQAFYTYKTFKEAYIKQVADEYKNLIPNKLYEALYKWEVEIND